MADKSSLENRLDELTKEYSKTKYNKATNKHLGILRKKISQVKKDIIESGKGMKGKGFFVKKTGDSTVALMGFPSTGKSSLINSLTNTRSKTAGYEFTTTTVVPGIMIYNGAHIQIFDMPGIIENAHLGSGGGRSVIAAMKVADLIVFVVDIDKLDHLRILLGELKSLNIMINRQRPRVYIRESPNNIGVVLETNRSGLSESEVKTVISGFGIANARVRIDESISIDDLIGLASGKYHYMRAIVALNKIDTREDYEILSKEISSKYGIQVVPVSATEKTNIDALKDAIYSNLGIITVYLRPKEDKTAKPLILKYPSTVGDAAAKVHTEILDSLKCAYITGPSAKFRNQRVGSEHLLKNGDTITFIKHR
ncbi:MAG: 50S ribosome-binding GTPase [Candidatus Micrarchaeota archaeon]|nr:50S ribosome-binding GTPase [Candidatus Micrarchaeota archaeon]